MKAKLAGSARQFFKKREDIFCNFAVLFFCSTTNADSTDDLSLSEQGISSGHQSNSGVVGLNGHERSPISRYVLGFVSGNGSSICFLRDEGNTQHERLSIPTVSPGQSMRITDCKADINPIFLLFSPATAHS